MQLPLAIRTVTVILIANWGGEGGGGGELQDGFIWSHDLKIGRNQSKLMSPECGNLNTHL